MKSVFIVALFGVLITISSAAKSSLPVEEPESRADLPRGQERAEKKEEKQPQVYHQTMGQELFQGETWMLLVPLILIPLIACLCYYLSGNSKGDEGWGWDRMGYSDNSVGQGQGQDGYPSGSYDSRSLVPADAMDKATHQRIMDSIQQQY